MNRKSKNWKTFVTLEDFSTLRPFLVFFSTILYGSIASSQGIFTLGHYCWGPAPVDPGKFEVGMVLERITYLFINIEI